MRDPWATNPDVSAVAQALLDTRRRRTRGRSPMFRTTSRPPAASGSSHRGDPIRGIRLPRRRQAALSPTAGSTKRTTARPRDETRIPRRPRCGALPRAPDLPAPPQTSPRSGARRHCPSASTRTPRRAAPTVAGKARPRRSRRWVRRKDCARPSVAAGFQRKRAHCSTHTYACYDRRRIDKSNFSWPDPSGAAKDPRGATTLPPFRNWEPKSRGAKKSNSAYKSGDHNATRIQIGGNSFSGLTKMPEENARDQCRRRFERTVTGANRECGGTQFPARCKTRFFLQRGARPWQTTASDIPDA